MCFKDILASDLKFTTQCICLNPWHFRISKRENIGDINDQETTRRQ
ncbi:MAG: hypothetical protein AVDCRST_MAG18-1566 [uncultured Thermomicrobiales bacterium]|uniref:Uncharacterized protein n=1 Tax=uncultured Thermomicrobiales bacterium TaxID=1645740 RepID=A0A6J4V2V6_9BACT|nr:MAG: hypothetical protein AVDCRST_MAG18-1566 [uncultured Thermomicrobiales bacterium]